MSLNPNSMIPPAVQPQLEGAWFIHVALQRYAQEAPEAAANTYYQEAMQEALAGYQSAMMKQ